MKNYERTRVAWIKESIKFYYVFVFLLRTPFSCITYQKTLLELQNSMWLVTWTYQEVWYTRSKGSYMRVFTAAHTSNTSYLEELSKGHISGESSGYLSPPGQYSGTALAVEGVTSRLFPGTCPKLYVEYLPNYETRKERENGYSCKCITLENSLPAYRLDLQVSRVTNLNFLQTISLHHQ